MTVIKHHNINDEFYRNNASNPFIYLFILLFNRKIISINSCDRHKMRVVLNNFTRNTITFPIVLKERNMTIMFVKDTCLIRGFSYMSFQTYFIL